MRRRRKSQPRRYLTVGAGYCSCGGTLIKSNKGRQNARGQDEYRCSKCKRTTYRY